jgi:multidrug efflux pump subunit AcrA (membrane-fusion protein)
MTSAHEGAKKPWNRFIRKGLWWKATLLLLAVFALTWWLWPDSGRQMSEGTTFAARKGNLRISVLEGGSIEALESQVIKSEIRGQTKILGIVEEGYMVTEEDVANQKILLTLDSADLEEKSTQQEIEYQSAAAGYTEAKEQYEIQIKQNESDIKSSELQVKFARMDFEKYLGADIANEILKDIGLDKMPEPEPMPEGSFIEGAEEDLERLMQESADEGPPAGMMPMDMAARQEGSGNAPVEGMQRPAGPGPDGAAGSAPGSGQRERPRGPRPDRPAGAGQGRPEGAGARPERPAGTGQADATAGARPTPPEGSAVMPPGDMPAMPDIPADIPVESAPATTVVFASSIPARPEIDFSVYADPSRLGDGEAQQKLRDLSNKRILAEEELKLAEVDFEGTQRLKERDFVTQQELDAEEMKVRRNRNSAESTVTDEDLFIKYEFPKQAEKLLSDYEEALRKLERTRKQAVSEMAQAEARLRSHEARYKLQAQRRKELIEQIAKCEIPAERTGLVVYAGSNEPWRNQERIAEGATVFERQEIITIPDMRQMSVSVKIHESAVKKVTRGQKATIRLDAFPDEILTGEVAKVGVLPDSSQRWMNPDIKVYSCSVTIDGVNDWLKPGMSAEVDILVSELADVVYVPIQAVSAFGGDRVCYVSGFGEPERRVVKTGQFNNEYIALRRARTSRSRGWTASRQPSQTPGSPRSPGRRVDAHARRDSRDRGCCQDLPDGHGDGRGAAGGEPHVLLGRLYHHHGTQRLREVDLAQPAGLPGPSHLGPIYAG